MDHFNNEPLKIKRRGEDGYRVITVRIYEATLRRLDEIAATLFPILQK